MTLIRKFVLVLVCAAPATVMPLTAAGQQFPPDSFTNLKVLPREIPRDSLVRMMASFTRALGVRCTHCHIGEETQSLAEYDFASDEKPAKQKARVMIEMINRINGDHLVRLPERAEPRLHVECFTCHRGVREPRKLQQILLAAWSAAGIDSVLLAYRGLRGRYYGGSAYDFGEVPLADVATEVANLGNAADAERLHVLNVELNPASAFAKRSHAVIALMQAFRQGAAPGRTRHVSLRSAYGETIVSEMLVNQTGNTLLRRKENAAAIEVFKLNVEEHPRSSNAHGSLGDAYAASGEVQQAKRSYERALELDPANTAIAGRLRSLRRLP